MERNSNQPTRARLAGPGEARLAFLDRWGFRPSKLIPGAWSISTQHIPGQTMRELAHVLTITLQEQANEKEEAL